MRFQFLPVVSDHNKFSQIRHNPNTLTVLKEESGAMIAVRWFAGSFTGDLIKRYELYSDGILIWYGDKVSKRILYYFRVAKELAACNPMIDSTFI